MIYVEQEKDLSNRKPTPKQLRALREVCATNGGGLSIHTYPKYVWQGLINRGLVQGKSGGVAVVHTRAGLELVRKEKSDATR